MTFRRSFREPVGVTAVAIIAAALIAGIKVALLIALLAVLEISISFDNAVVNASVLERMAPRWQRVFLTWGILIAVFGMRLLFPMIIVAAASGTGITAVVDRALNHPHVYAESLGAANPVIAAFGGTFLLLVFLNFFFDPDRELSWIRPLEARMAGLGRVQSISIALAGGILLGADQLVSADHRLDVLTAGVAGLVVYLVVSSIADRLEPEGSEEPRHVIGMVAKAGLASFLYLEVLDASFSFDGVIGAFAISKEVLVIAVGLGLGAMYIRTLTVWLVRQGTLRQYAYLEHGAHWAIGTLGVLLFVSIEHHIPELVTGLIGAALIGCALLSSVIDNRRRGPPASYVPAREAASGTGAGTHRSMTQLTP